ncbi:MAG: BatA domain-containing protein [Verrucomicrobiia bacterium]
MGFLNPLMLFGLAAISVPIIIHLLNRRKFQRVVWAAMRFLKESVQQNQRRIHLEDIVLLIIRCLLIALIALALARPAIKSEAKGILGAKTTSVLILDNSYSMSLTDGVSDMFTRARKIAEEIVSRMEPGSSSALFLASDTVRAIVPEPTYDVNLLRRALADARLSGRSSDLMPSLKQALEVLRTHSTIRKEIYIITDGQYLAWKNFKEIQNLLKEAKMENIQITIIIVGEQEERNLGITRFSIASGLAPLNKPIRFEVQISNFGVREENNIKVNIGVDGNPPCDEVIIDRIPTGSSKTVSLFAKFYSDGFHSLVAKIPQDRLPADDSRAVVVRTVKEVRALLVDGNPGAEPREGQAFYLKHSLQPVSPSEAQQYFLKPTVVTLKDLSNIKFDDFDVVFLLDIPQLQEQTLAALEYFVKRGGGLVVFPGAQTTSAFYNDIFFRKYKLLPAMIGNIKGNPDKQESYFSFQEKNYTHPIVEIWNDPASGTLSSARFYAAFDLIVPESKINLNSTNTGNITGAPKVILNYTDGKPAIVENSIGFGRVVLFSSTANTMWNDLPVRPAYVPLIHRIVGSIMSGQYNNLTIRVGDPFIYRVSSEYLGRDVMVTHPDSTTNSPRHLIKVELLNDLPAIQYNETDIAGVYTVAVAEEVENPIKFAVQPDPSESNLAHLSKDQLDTISKESKVLRWRDGVSVQEEIQKNRFGIELWFPIAIIVLLLAITESALAQYFSKTK